MGDSGEPVLEDIATALVDACVTVHRTLGPGLMESTYQACLAHELQTRGVRIDREVGLPVHYKGLSLEVGYRIDMIVENILIVENKCVAPVLPVHEAQLLTYLKLSRRRVGFLINWNYPSSRMESVA